MMNVATIGSGMIVDWFLNAAKQNDITCVAMLTRCKAHVEALAATYGIHDIYTDFDAMMARADIDFVYIASPNSLHYSYAMRAMRAGKHVICEKPFASNVAEFDEMCAYAKQHNRFLFEAIVTLHMPNYHTIQAHVGSLGSIRMVQCNFSQYSSRYDLVLAGQTPNVFNPLYSGGALADIGIYNLHFVIALFGKPRNVHYYPNKHANGIDVSGAAVLEYDGFYALCVGCKDTKSQCITQIQGTKGYLVMDSETSKCSHVCIEVDGVRSDITQPQNDCALYYELQDFKRMFEADDKAACWKMFSHNRIVMEVFEALRKDGDIVYAADHK